MGERLQFLESSSDLQKAKVADTVLPGIHIFLEQILAKENLSKDVENLRFGYVSLLKCSKAGSREDIRRQVKNCLEVPPTVKHETCYKTSKLGQVKEKRLINIRQFQLNTSNENQDPVNKMESDLLAAYTTDDESRLITSDVDDSFVALTKSEDELSTKAFSKITGDTMNSGFLYYKDGDGLRRRWVLLDDHVLKCYKRQNQNLLFELNFRDGDFYAMQGRIGKMFAIRVSCTKESRSYLFASPKSEVCASWLMMFSAVGVQLQDDILRKVSMNRQNINKVTWSLRAGESLREDDEVTSDVNLLEALEFLERSKSPRILPKRSSYSFKELDVLKKLKTSLVSKKTECKLNRRKTWSAGSLPNNIGFVERFRKPLSVSEGDGLASEQGDEKANGPDKGLPELLTSSGVVKIDKHDSSDLGTSGENVDKLASSDDEFLYAFSVPEGLNKEHLAENKGPHSPSRSPTLAKSVPDLLILPGQESPQLSHSGPERPFRRSGGTLTRVLSMKASLMKNAIVTSFKRRGRRGVGRDVLDRDLADIHGCLFRKKGLHWKRRWCIVAKETFYAFHDSLYEHEDFTCSLRKCIAMRGEQEPGHAHTFRLVRRKGDEILLAAKDDGELERWLVVLRREMAKPRLSAGGGSRSSSLTTSSLYGAETFGESSAAEDTLTDVDRSESYYAETTDKDSSDEHSTCSVPMTTKPRGINEKGYVYYMVHQDTWKHCWMDVSCGMVSIYTDQTKGNALQRDHLPLCDIQEDTTDGQRSHKFVLKRAGRKPIYLEVDGEADFSKWIKCFKSWKAKDSGETTESKENTEESGETKENDVNTATNHLLGLPRSSPIGGTPATSDSDCGPEGTELKKNDQGRPKIRRAMTSVLSQLTPKLTRRNKSTAGMIDISEVNRNAVKSSYLYYKANTGLWVKYWCVLESSLIFCFSSPEQTRACFTVDVQGCEIRRTSCKTKNFTFDIFNRSLDKHLEFAGESTYVMYAWMRLLKIASGLAPKNLPTKSDEVPGDKQPGGDGETPAEVQQAGDTVDGETAGDKEGAKQMTSQTPSNHSSPRSSVSSQPSPKRKTNKITSLDQVLKLLHEKQLKQELQTKELSSSERARMKWQHSMLVVLRKSRSLTNLENGRFPTTVVKPSTTVVKPSAPVVNESESAVPVEWDEKTARVKYREISEKYDHILEDEKLKMLRRETLLKKRRNSLILHEDILQKKLGKCQESAKAPLKKRQSKTDAKEMAFTKGDVEEVTKNLAEIRSELEVIQKNIEENLTEQKRISFELNEQKRKELHDLRITVDMSSQTWKSNLHDQHKSAHRRQASDSSLSSARVSEEHRKLLARCDADKPKLTQSLSSPTVDLRAKAKSFSTSRLPKVPSSPVLRAKTMDGSGLERPTVRSRASQEALSLALSQIEDFETFAQGSLRNNGAHVGC